jgi:hypothetical protein
VWSGFAFLVLVVSGRPLVITEVLLPLSLAAAWAVAALARDLAARFRWGEEGAMAAVLVVVACFAALQGAKLAFQTPPGDDGLFLLTVGSVAMLGLLVALYVGLWGPAVAARAAGLAALFVLPAAAWAQGSGIVAPDGRTVREPLRSEFVTSDLANLVHNVEMASWNRTRDPHSLELRIDPALAPLLAWPLRAQRGLTWGPGRGTVEAEAVIRPADTGGEGFGPAPYVGHTYEPSGRWLPTLRPPDGGADPHATLRTAARWYLQRRSPGAALETDLRFDRVDLYLKAEAEG